MCEHTKLINGILSEYKIYPNGSFNRDDLFQEAWLKILEIQPLYDETKGATFNTFANIIIKRHLNRFIAQNLRAGERVQIADSDNNENPMDSLPSGINYNTEIEYQDLLASLHKTNGGIYNDYINMLAKGQTQVEISEHFGMSPKLLNIKIQQMREVVEKKCKNLES